jgi:hypothetical protein
MLKPGDKKRFSELPAGTPFKVLDTHGNPYGQIYVKMDVIENTSLNIWYDTPGTNLGNGPVFSRIDDRDVIVTEMPKA